MQTTILVAFGFGLLSAASLPLGSLTSKFWRPSDRWIAFLMSFGGGALLAALTIDLAAPSVEKGHFTELAVGCITGSLLFIFLDQMVAQKGGFLRKFSSTIYYLHKRERQRFRDLSAKIRRLELFDDLLPEEAQALAAGVSALSLKEGSYLFREGDPAENIYVIEEGQVNLLDPSDHDKLMQTCRGSDAIGFKACLTLSPHAASAVAATDVRLLCIPLQVIQEVLQSSWEFQKATTAILKSKDIEDYLELRHHLAPEEAHHWIGLALDSIAKGKGLPPRSEKGTAGLSGDHPTVDSLASLPQFAKMPREEIAAFADRCFLKKHDDGHTFFYAGENADRLYILQSGAIEIIDPKDSNRSPRIVKPHETFGALSFLTGQRHSVNAVAKEPSTVLVLLRHDFDRMLHELPSFSAAIREVVQDEPVSDYLRRKHDFSEDKALTWVKRAVGNLGSRKRLPSSASMSVEISQHQGAPLAIWLGILLDGIPESFVIGASVLKGGGVSASLMAGLFLSNFPEALSSSVGMRQQGMSFRRIFVMWTSLMLITGIGAALGAVFFQGVPPPTYALVEGIAAGAMLTMIAQTMLPEAFLKGGSIVGFSTLLGFLTAIAFKTLDGGGGH